MFGHNINSTINTNIKTVKESKKPSRVFYKMSIEKHGTTPQKIKNKWNEKINGNISDDQWKHIFSQPFIETDDSKLQTLQFRINHRIFIYKHFSYEN